ncbi:MAG: hypothetical protein INR64_14540 [Caulobacteraceae bacterium]|nr:hypothetical protein [Caulobacter sp.]
MPTPDTNETAKALPPPKPPAARRRTAVAAALAGAFVVGGGVAALALQNRQPTLVMLTPAPVATMKDGGAVAVKGQVAEIFGNKFVVDDGTGRALVETGPKGERSPLVAKAETVTVQGRFENGFIHAQAVSHADGRNDLIGPAAGGPPPPPPPGGPLADRDPAPPPVAAPAGAPVAPDAPASAPAR